MQQLIEGSEERDLRITKAGEQYQKLCSFLARRGRGKLDNEM